MEKRKLSIDEQYNYLNNEMGIKTLGMTQEDVKHYLIEHNYFFKLKSYAKNYEKWRLGENKGKYKNLYFEYLIELSKLDMYLRKVLQSMSINLEHSLRLLLITTSTSNKDTRDDGYQIVKDFLQSNKYISDQIERASNSYYTYNVYEKYKNGFPLWVIVELLTFGWLSSLLSYYNDRFKNLKLNPQNGYYAFNVRHLRNAVAHNNCLINNLNTAKERGMIKFQIDSNLKKYILSNVKKLSKEEVVKNLSIPIIQDFVSLLIMYDSFVISEKVKNNDYRQLNDLFKIRFLENRVFFEDNYKLKSIYKFIVTIIDFIIAK